MHESERIYIFLKKNKNDNGIRCRFCRAINVTYFYFSFTALPCHAKTKSLFSIVILIQIYFNADINLWTIYLALNVSVRPLLIFMNGLFVFVFNCRLPLKLWQSKVFKTSPFVIISDSLEIEIDLITVLILIDFFFNHMLLTCGVFCHPVFLQNRQLYSSVPFFLFQLYTKW